MKKYILLLVFLILAFPLVKERFFNKKETILPVIESIEGRPIRPTDVYYLARSIDDSLVRMHNLYQVFEKERLAEKIKPQNVFQRVIFIAEEYNYLHGASFGKAPIDKDLINEFRNLDRKIVQPKHVYAVLNLIKRHLVSRGQFVEYHGERSEKNPSDVYQVLRQISYHNLELVGQKSPVAWNKPARVFDINFFETYALLKSIAKKYQIPLKFYAFPLQAKAGKKPKDVYAKQVYLHELLERYYHISEPGYSPVSFNAITNKGLVSPDDVFDLSQIMLAELKWFYGNPPLLSKQEISDYYDWKSNKKQIAAGDVYNLVEQNILIMKEILKRVEKRE